MQSFTHSMKVAKSTAPHPCPLNRIHSGAESASIKDLAEFDSSGHALTNSIPKLTTIYLPYAKPTLFEVFNVFLASKGFLLPLLCCYSLTVLYAVAKPSPTPPEVPREFRGLWIATVGNIDWPSKPGLPTEQQQKELIQILNQATNLNFNAVILQIRPACDALYKSALEPWSEYLTGKMGVEPLPFYDPLAFAVEQCHLRGLELHAWFNPFRAKVVNAKSKTHPSHVSESHPNWIRAYGNLLWLDPGLADVHKHAISVILDVLKRYDVDGIHLDDYFYPYPDQRLINPDFPDQKTFSTYTKQGGKLSKLDWRRNNVNLFVETLHREIKKHKSWVKFGISPFGIWRPDHPPGIRGLDAYDQLAADARLWLQKGWLDYASPQLYWSTSSKEQNFSALLNWWSDQNKAQRHLWPGLATSNLEKGWRTEEIQKQIKTTRLAPNVTGHIHYGAKTLFSTQFRQLPVVMKNTTYSIPALIPPSPWLGNAQPAPPLVELHEQKGTNALLLLQKPSAHLATHWVVQYRIGSQWQSKLLPVSIPKFALPKALSESQRNSIYVSTISRTGIQSKLVKPSPRKPLSNSTAR